MKYSLSNLGPSLSLDQYDRPPYMFSREKGSVDSHRATSYATAESIYFYSFLHIYCTLDREKSDTAGVERLTLAEARLEFILVTRY